MQARLKDKDIDSILREEFLRERAMTLARAGEKLQTAINEMEILALTIERLTEELSSLTEKQQRAETIAMINAETAHYNSIREHAKLRHYYLIVTREALGLRRHKTVEEIYSIPPQRELLRAGKLAVSHTAERE